ncbi:unnamed protein product [Coccothraustes coccothraustes]
MAAVSVSGFAAVRPSPPGTRRSRPSVSNAGGAAPARVVDAEEVGDRRLASSVAWGRGRPSWALQARGLFRPRRRSAPGPAPPPAPAALARPAPRGGGGRGTARLRRAKRAGLRGLSSDQCLARESAAEAGAGLAVPVRGAGRAALPVAGSTESCVGPGCLPPLRPAPRFARIRRGESLC